MLEQHLASHRWLAEQALVTVVATAYLLGASDRRVERLASSSGSKACRARRCRRWLHTSMARSAHFASGRWMPGPTPSCGVDALTVKVREKSRVVTVHALVATGVNADGHRAILGLDVASAEDDATTGTAFAGCHGRQQRP